MLTLTTNETLLLGGLLAAVAALMLVLLIGTGAALWAWSWAARFDTLSADRQEDGEVILSAKLKPRPDPKRKRGKLVGPSNGVRKVETRKALS